MSDILRNGEPESKPEWPQWIGDALAYRPESPAAELESKAASSEINDPRKIRRLSRVAQP